MAFVVESTSTVSANNADNLTITKPASVAVGDLLILVANGEGASTKPTCTGFTEILTSAVDSNEDTNVTMLYRIADASDVSASNYTVALANSTSSGAAAMLRVSGWTSGNPLYASSANSTVIDSASYAIGASGLTIARPGQQLLIIAGNHKSDDNHATYSNFAITSSDSNPSWTIVANSLAYTTESGVKEQNFFLAYALSSNTSTITAYSADVGSSISGGIDSDAYFLAVLVVPISPTPDVSHLAVTPTVEGVTVSSVTVAPDVSHIAITPTIESITATATKPTQWTNEAVESTVWTNEDNLI